MWQLDLRQDRLQLVLPDLRRQADVDEARPCDRCVGDLVQRGKTRRDQIGQGTRTMHAQIVTDALGIPYESVEVAQPDTSKVADSGPTVASRTCMVVGKILQ